MPLTQGDKRSLLAANLQAMSNMIAGRPPVPVPELDTEVDGASLEPVEPDPQMMANLQGPDATPAPVNPNVGDSDLEQQVEWFLAGLRQHESGNQNVKSRYSSASGYYQYINSTWGGYGGYARAMDAPFEVQHERARRDALAAFKKYGSWQDAAMAHFYPKFAGNRDQWNYIPGEENGKAFSGNPTGWRYVNSVMRKMNSAAGGQVVSAGSGSTRQVQAAPEPEEQRPAPPVASGGRGGITEA